MSFQLVKPAFAQTATSVDIGQTFVPASGFNTVSSLVNTLLRNVFTIAGVIAFVFVVIAGLNMIVHAGSGDAKQVESDKNAFTSAIIGLMIIVGTYFILQIVGYIIGFDFLNPQLG